MRTLRPMRTAPLLLIVLAALLAPAQALAAGSASATTDRYFVITGLVLGDQKIEASGKMAIQGGQLMASVGCNSIGGKVSVDGDVVTITEPLVQTEMACQGVAMAAEDALAKILDHGPFRITAGAWVGNGAQIDVDELDVPAAGRTLPPDQPIGSSPAPIVDPLASCPPIEIDPGFGGGSTGSGGSSGSGGGTTGVGTAPGAGSAGSAGSEGNAGSGATPGENPAGTAVAEPAGTAMAEPVEVPPATPATEPGGEPDPNATPGLDEGPAPDIGTDPGVGKPPIDLDPCARAYANDLTSGAGTGGIPPQDAAAAAEHEKSAALGLDSATILPAAAAALLVLLVFAALVVRRWRATRPGTAADASR